MTYRFHNDLFYYTCGAFYHPVFRKTAFLHITNADAFQTPIRCKVFFDENQNQLLDPGETIIGRGYLSINARERIYLHNEDVLFHPRDEIIDTIQYYPPDHWKFTTDSIAYVQPMDTDTVYFGIYLDAPANDLSIDLTPDT
jgi:hypothetical protein